MHANQSLPKHMSQPKKPAAVIQRYDPIEFYDQGGSGYGSVKRCDDGDFVRYDDVKELIEKSAASIGRLGGKATSPAKTAACRANAAKPRPNARKPRAKRAA